MDLEGRVALITGGARRLGRAITDALAEAGCRLVLHYGRSREAAESAVDQLARRGVDVLCVGADLARDEEIEQMFSAVARRFGGLDILVNSAATFEKRALADITAGDWDAVMAVNLRAPFLCLRQALPLLHSAQRPNASPAAVINIADLSGVLPWPGYAHHGVSKAGLLQLTRVAARELAPRVRVNAVVPGVVLPPPGISSDNEDFRELAERIPARRAGHTSEIGATVVFLARNDFIFGEALFVDGGEHLLGAGHRQM